MRNGTPPTFEAERNRLVEDLAAVVDVLDRYRDELDEYSEARTIRELRQVVPGESSALLKKDRLLRLGIVGQIKAGKSTLLNLLLFDGREVLPRAATPMTAALTHIVRSDELGDGQAEIEVDFYSRDEWQDIEKHADEYRKAKQAGRNPDGFLRACHEIVEMAAQRGASSMDHTDTDIRSVPVDELNAELHRLVGADGELAPLVKSVTIRCGEGIPDLDIVDTPGLNDPIISRVRATRKKLAECDAVLLLSYAGQFMDSSDLKLLTDTMPDEGIRRRVVIGSKFDSALIDEARKCRGDLTKACADIEKKLREIATKSERPDDDGHSFDDRNVVFVSAMCAILSAKRDAGQWSDAERDAFDALRRSYPDWFDSPEDDSMNEDTAYNLALVGRRERVDELVSDIRNDKDRIMRDKVRGYLRRKRNAVKGPISTLIDALKEHQNEVRTAEIEQLKSRRLESRKAMDRIEAAVIDTWRDSLKAQREGITRTRERSMDDISEAREGIKDAVSTKTFRRKKPGGFLGIPGFFRSLMGNEWETYEEKVINVTSLQLTIEGDSDKLRTIIHAQLREMFDHDYVGDIQKKLRTIVANSLPNDIASTVDRSLGASLSRAVATVAADARKAIEKHMAGSFPGRIELRGGTMDSTLEQARQHVNALSDYAYKLLNDAGEIMDNTIMKAESDLVPVAIQDIEAYYDRIESEISEREFKLQRYQQAIDELQRFRKRLEA